MWRNWNLHTLLVGIKNSAVSLEKSLEVLQEVEHKLVYYVVSLLVGAHPREVSTYIHAKTCMKCSWALLITAQKWEQPGCSPTSERTNNM